jgi:hypothetical protein
MRSRVLAVLSCCSLFLLLGIASAQHCSKADEDPSTGFCTVPDPDLTPGEMDASLVCVSNQDRPRKVTMKEKMPSLRHTDIQQIQISLLASSITGCRIGWEARTGQKISGSNHTRENSVHWKKIKSNSSSGEKCVRIFRSLCNNQFKSKSTITLGFVSALIDMHTKRWRDCLESDVFWA